MIVFHNKKMRLVDRHNRNTHAHLNWRPTLSDGVNTYAWDRADHLLSMGAVQNQDNGLGQRV